MTTDYIYQPVRKGTLASQIRDFYWSYRDGCDAVMFISVLAMVAAVLVQMA